MIDKCSIFRQEAEFKMHRWKVTKYIYSSTEDNYNFKVLYLSVAIFCYLNSDLTINKVKCCTTSVTTANLV